jgi:hypothetical protein
MVQSNRQARIVGEDRLHADQDGVVLRPQAMGEFACILARDPALISFAMLLPAVAYESVKGGRHLHRDRWALGSYPGEEDPVLLVAFVLEATGIHTQACPAQKGDAAATHKRILVAAADHHALDARTKNGLGAGTGTALMAAGLQGHVECGAWRAHSHLGKRFDFGVRQASAAMKASRHDLATLNEDRANYWIGPREPAPALSQAQGFAHVAAVVVAEGGLHAPSDFERMSRCTSCMISPASLRDK